MNDESVLFPIGCVTQASTNVRRSEVREISEDLFLSHP